MGGVVKTSLSVIGGAVASKVGAQLVLGSKNSGILGYLGNAVAGGVLAWASKMVFKDRAVAHGIVVGTAVQIILRVIGDQTAFGSYLSLSGLGDYMASNFVQPQRLLDPLNSAMVEQPNGWGPGAMPLLTQAAVASGSDGMSGLYSGAGPGAGSLY